MIRALAQFSLLALLTFSATAQTTLHYREGERVEPRDVKAILDSTQGATGGTRSIRMLGSVTAAAGTSAAAPTALSLPVRFEFDSATILPSTREQLDALAAGIKLLPSKQTVHIEGHTDASGADDYNLQLSQRRAAAVKLYLVQTHGIDAHRLRDTGVGKHQPISGTDPFAAENRRVQFRGG